MCDRRELDKIREQRDDAIEREQALLGPLTEMTTERDALAEILHETTEELAHVLARCESRACNLGPA